MQEYYFLFYSEKYWESMEHWLAVDNGDYVDAEYENP